jgi:hypothetical protein
MTMHLVEIDPAPIEIDPRPCELCGLTIDRHQMVDLGEGPLFYCIDLNPNDLTTLELERRAVLIEREEVRAIMARMDAMGGWPADIPPPREPEPYRPAQSTVDAFWIVVEMQEPERFKAWVADRPKDAPLLLQLLEGK